MPTGSRVQRKFASRVGARVNGEGDLRYLLRVPVSRLPLFGTVAGVVVGSVIAVVLVVSGTLTVPVRRDTTDASQPFLDAWKRSRETTVLVRSDFRRQKGDGSTLYSAAELVQRPPDRIVRQFGGLNGTVNGHSLQCSTDATGNFRCFTSEAEAPPYDEAMREELDNLRSYFTPAKPGAAPLYRVIRAPLEADCFELFEDLRYPDPPYGHYAKFCFDAATGALRYLERQLAERVIEKTEAVSISTSVLPTDLSPERSSDFESRLALGDVPEPRPPSADEPTGAAADSAGPPGSGPPGTVQPAEAPPTTEDPNHFAEFDSTPNEQLVRDGSALLAAGENGDRYVITALNRLYDRSLSINDPLWIDVTGAPKAMLRPVIAEMLRQGIYPGP